MPSARKRAKTTPQTDLFYEYIVDCFAGGGGASVGIEMATGRVVDVAINHDPDAILMHQTNHPHTAHYQEDVWHIDPKKVCGGHPVGLAWFSPTCTHFSKAKGLPLVDRHIRGLAWVTLRWIEDVRPRGIILENVEEFQTWGPLMPDPKGRGMVPDPAHKGETFQAFIQMLTTGCKERNAAFFEACEELIIDPYGEKAQHLLDGFGYDVEFRELTAADYGAATTRKRFFLIARCDGKPIVWPEPTHAPRNSEAVRKGLKKPWKSAAGIIDWSLPCPSIFDTRQDIMEKYGMKAVRPLANNTMRRIARGLDKFVLKSSQPFIIPRGYGERVGQKPRVHDINAPVPTTVGTAKHAVVVPNLVNVCHSGEFRGQSVEAPMPTLLGKNSHALVETALAPWEVTNTSNSIGSPASQPVHTVTTAGNQMLVTANIVHYHTEQSESVRGQTVDKPLATIDTANRHGLVVASLTEFYSANQSGASIDQPLHTVMGKPHHGLTAAHLAKYYGGVDGVGVDKPLPTVTAIDHNALVKTTIEKVVPGMDLGHWPEIRALLNEHCGYTLAEDEILLLYIGGSLYFISDIGLRMLCPKELYAANSFPKDYIIERDYRGNKYSPTKQVARCGNAVPPAFASALVAANYPEWCAAPVTTMAELEDRVAV